MKTKPSTAGTARTITSQQRQTTGKARTTAKIRASCASAPLRELWSRFWLLMPSRCCRWWSTAPRSPSSGAPLHPTFYTRDTIRVASAVRFLRFWLKYFESLQPSFEPLHPEPETLHSKRGSLTLHPQPYTWNPCAPSHLFAARQYTKIQASFAPGCPRTDITEPPFT